MKKCIFLDDYEVSVIMELLENNSDDLAMEMSDYVYSNCDIPDTLVNRLNLVQSLLSRFFRKFKKSEIIKDRGVELF